MPIFLEVDESRDPRTTGTYEPDRVPQGFQAPDTYGRMRPNRFAGAKIGGGYDAPQGTPTWEPSWDQTSGITHPNLNGYQAWNATHSEGPSLEELRQYNNPNWEYNKAQVNLNEPSARAAEWEQFNKLRGKGYDPFQFLTIPMTTEDDLIDYNEFGDQQWAVQGEISPELEANIPNWYKWYDKLIKRFGQEKGSQLWQQYANRGGIIGLNGGGTIHKDSRTPLPDDLRDQMYDWILQQMMRQRQEEMMEQWGRDRNPMLYPPPIPEGGMEV